MLGEIILVVSCLATYESLQLGKDAGERERAFAEARSYADSVGKSLLVVGTPKTGFHMYHPCGDYTIDIDDSIPTDCDVQIADVRDIPYPDFFFGSVFCSHVLEHLPTPEDAYLALKEMERVADRYYIVVPNKSSIIAWLHPDHHLWVTIDGDELVIKQR